MPGATTNRSVRGDVRTVWIANVRPELDGGRFPVKREVGNLFEVTADILREGHEALAAFLKYRTVKDTGWHEIRMEPMGNDSWVARSPLEENTRYVYTIEAYPDPYRTWAEDLKKRLALAATLSSLYGIYSGYELCENAAIPGTEEYQDSEKYEIKVRDWDVPGNIKDYIARVNAIRRENPALQEYRNLRFYEGDDDNVLFYGKSSFDGRNTILVAVNLDPFEAHQAQVRLRLSDLGIGVDERFQVHELITDERHLWKGPVQTIRLDPREEPAAIFQVSRFPHKDYGTPCY